jgi:hypothetical protein
MLFRNDDVNPNSNFKHIKEIYSIIKNKFPDAQIYSCITILGEKNSLGRVYPQFNLQNHLHLRKFINVDLIFDLKQLSYLQNIASHGLFHFSHARVAYETQKFSIVSSCNLLKTKVFVPPYMEINEETEQICKLAEIELWKDSDNWSNLDTEKIDFIHTKYYFHSWKFTPESFYKKLNEK